jgi:hypothetical protein
VKQLLAGALFAFSAWGAASISTIAGVVFVAFFVGALFVADDRPRQGA